MKTIMKKFGIVISLFIVLSAFSYATYTWTNDDPHSQLSFSVNHLGVATVTGYFKDFDVRVNSSRPDFSDATVELTAKVASIDTRVEARDNHLKSADFFNAEKYPTLYFKSTAIRAEGDNEYKLTGNLSIGGITKKVTVNLTYRGTVENAMTKKQTAGLQVTGMIKRSDFNLGNGFKPPMISDEVFIKADGEFIQNDK